MSSSPLLPENVQSQLKSFWSRPEGKAGMVVLAGLILGGGLMFWGTVVPFLVTMMADTLHLIYLTIGVVVTALIVFNKRFQYTVGLGFRLIMRFLTGLLINVDPIGILEDHLTQMRKRRESLAEQIASVNGQVRYLKDTISKNKDLAEKNLAMAQQAKKMAQTNDQQRALEMQLQVRAKANKAGRLEQSNLSYQQLLTKLQMIYDMLSKWATHIDFFIEDTEDQVTQAKVQYKTLNSAYRAYRTALAVIKGNADENEIYNATMERLAEDASRKLGEMEDFQKVAQNFMDTIDIQNGAVETQALQKLEQYEQKLLTAGNQETAFLLPENTKQAVPVQVKKSNNYEDLLK